MAPVLAAQRSGSFLEQSNKMDERCATWRQTIELSIFITESRMENRFTAGVTKKVRSLKWPGEVIRVRGVVKSYILFAWFYWALFGQPVRVPVWRMSNAKLAERAEWGSGRRVAQHAALHFEATGEWVHRIANVDLFALPVPFGLLVFIFRFKSNPNLHFCIAFFCAVQLTLSVILRIIL